MPDLIDRLRTALEGRYTIERELGRGGMAIVYLAEDLKHGRPVALKVLRPELAASLGAERFLREITTAARLTHPNILPLHDSGEVDGTLYYSMPYVAGESLRVRLERERQLPIDEALRITQEVAEGLGYAHTQGIIHRDIKPENILLAGGRAVIADFGIATAVTEAGGERLTATGVVVGTPAYMSPEQAGSGVLDGRSDLYSLGCVLYEMLSGETPYTGPTPQTILAKKMSEPTPHISVVREAVPPPVETALTRALARTPADRYATAVQFSAALFSEASPSLQRVRRRRRLRRLALVGLAALVAGAAGGYGAWWFLATGRPGTVFASGVVSPGDRIVLADFTNRTSDSTLADAVAIGIRVTLAEPRLVRVLDAAAVQRALRRMDRTADTPIDEAVAREIAERQGATAVVTGEVGNLGSGYQFTVRVIGTADGRELLIARETARTEDEIIDAVDRLGGRLRRGIGESVRAAQSRPALPEVSTGSIEALRHYAASMGLPRAEAIAEVQHAIEIDTMFAAAYIRAAALINQIRSGTVAEAQSLASTAYRLRHRLPEIERLWVEALYHELHAELDVAGRGFEKVLSFDPEHRGALLQLGDLRLAQRRLAEAESLSLRLMEAERPDPPSYFACWNAIEAQVALGRFEAADAVLRRLPHCTGLPRLQFQVLAARRDYAAAEAYLHDWVAAGVSRGDSFFVFRANLPTVLIVQGRLAAAAPLWDGNPTVRRDLYWAGYEFAYTGDTARASRKIDRAVESDNWDWVPSKPSLYERLVPLLAQVGRVSEARELLDDWLTLEDPALERHKWESMGWIALAEGRLDSAVASFRAWNAAPDYGGNHLYNRGWVEAGSVYDRAGNLDSAIALYERAFRMPFLDGSDYEIRWYPGVLRRLGELHAERGDVRRAIDYYRRFIDLWKDADPELQPQVEEARTALARLTAARP
jgi:serine/threonine-protein kinase